MNRRERTEYLIEYGKEESLKMAKQIKESYNIEMISPPKEVLVMTKVRESAQNQLFYLGEVLATETKVRMDGKIGLGLVKGADTEWSKALALIDAAYEAQIPETKEWTEIFTKLKERKQEREQQEKQKLAPTKVSFETMNQ